MTAKGSPLTMFRQSARIEDVDHPLPDRRLGGLKRGRDAEGHHQRPHGAAMGDSDGVHDRPPDRIHVARMLTCSAESCFFGGIFRSSFV